MENQLIHISLLSLHGLIRAKDPELGRDADTGGQVLYALELARALAHHPQVGQVDLLTRRIEQAKYAPVYAEPTEPICDKARIVRIPFGPRRYLRKEQLWPYLPMFVDNTLRFYRAEGALPDFIHGHYADAGMAAAQLASILDLPLAFTGHSLGRVKLERLLAAGQKTDSMEKKFAITQRIEAEETALDNAMIVITSTQQEISQQYELYHHYEPDRMRVVPPGINEKRFFPQKHNDNMMRLRNSLSRFLRRPEKPMVLAISRADSRKNIETLVEAYGRSPRLQELANLLLVMGTREDLASEPGGARDVITRVLYLIDKYDLYGKVAYPQSHRSDDVPDFYRLAARQKGVFINPAYTEPFGLTLLEAAGSGVPIVATNDGGPKDIIGNCNNGYLIDPMSADDIAEKLIAVLEDRRQWGIFARNGIRGVQKHYTWDAHVARYMKIIAPIIKRRRSRKEQQPAMTKQALTTFDRLLVCDIDNTLTGDAEGLAELFRMVQESPAQVAFAVATGRSRQLVFDAMKEWNIPQPNLMITDVGSNIYFGKDLRLDQTWKERLNYRWDGEKVKELLEEEEGLTLQEEDRLNEHKISFYIDEEATITVPQIKEKLRQNGISANVILSHASLLDILPVRCSKGLAVRHFADRWGIPPERILTAGDSGNDIGMLKGNTLGVVVGNYSEEVERLRGEPRVYFAEAQFARGVIEGIHHYNFLDEIRTGEDEVPEAPAEA